MTPPGRKVLFIDRDGTLVEEPDDHQVDTLAKVRLMVGVIPALLALRDAGFQFVMVSNQDGLGSNSFPRQQFDLCQEHILNLFSSQGITFEPILICPHFEEDGCGCRKPKTGLLSRFLAKTSLDVENCAVIGDRQSDLDLARNLGINGFMVDPNGDAAQSWDGIRSALVSRQRSARIERTTRETSICVTVNLDDAGPVEINSGIGFYDHMLEQIARHGGFALTLSCDGDLQIDEHHTVEDTAICIGTALRKALGDKRGIARYGFLLPMDESEARVSLDLSGRAAFVFSGEFSRESVGGLPSELVTHFFQSLAESLGAALHIEVTGDNNHHMIEACFKCVGRALRQAINVTDSQLPSTKGVLS
jgi:imidazoleglycerol-phosphate dehydratase/histidinol-phosphatase